MDTNSGRFTRKSSGMLMYSSIVHSVLAREYGLLRFGAKLLARAAGVSPRTADNWLQGICAPRGDELLRLMRECAALRDEIIRATEADRS
jgi:transcriptional regulator with XRE-family HTH domain